MQEQPQPRIINGQNAPNERFPWFVRTYAGNPDANGAVEACGGSLIAPDLVITAAHCETPEYVDVSAHNLDQINTKLRRKVVASTRHPDFPQKLQVDFDVMILKLESPVSEVQPVQLNFDDSTPSQSGERLKIIGFGSTIPGSSAPIVTTKTLQIADTNYVPFEECAVAKDPESGYKYGINIENTFVEPWWLCTLKTRPEVTATCYGDSGGPVLRQGNNAASDLLVGVISGGSGSCGNAYLPLWNNRVSYHQDWIVSIGCDMSIAAPSNWNCRGAGAGGGAGGAGGNNLEGSGSGGGGNDSTNDGVGGLGIVVGVTVVFLVILCVGFSFWRHRKLSAGTSNKQSKLTHYDEESPIPTFGFGKDRKQKKDPLSVPISTMPPSPNDRIQSHIQNNTNDKSPLARRPSDIFNRKMPFDSVEGEKSLGRFGRRLSIDPSVLTRRPSDLFNRKMSLNTTVGEKSMDLFGRKLSTNPLMESRPSKSGAPMEDNNSGSFGKRKSMDSTSSEDSRGLFGRKLSVDPVVEKRQSNLELRQEDRKNGVLARRKSMEPSSSERPTGWFARLPSMVHRKGEKDENDSFVPKDIADMVNMMDQELEGILADDVGKNPSCHASRGRSKSTDRFKSSSAQDHGRSRSRSVDRRGSSDFAARRGREVSRDSSAPRSRSMDRSQQGRSRSRDLSSSIQGNERARPDRSRSKSRDPDQFRRSRSRSADARPKSSSALLGIINSRPSHGGPQRTPPPRTRSDVISSKPSLSNHTSRPRGEGPTAMPPPRTKSDSVALSSNRSSRNCSEIPATRRSSDIHSIPRRPSFGAGKHASARKPPPRTKSDVTPYRRSSDAGRDPPTTQRASGNPPFREDDKRYLPSAAATPTSPVRRPPPRTRSDDVSQAAKGGRSDAKTGGAFKSGFDQWKERENLNPVVTKNSDGTVTVAKSRVNEEGMKVITKTKYASVELARRHGIDV